MAHFRSLPLLLVAVISLPGWNDSWCHAQNRIQYQTYPSAIVHPSGTNSSFGATAIANDVAHSNTHPSSPWVQAASNDVATYHPSRIDDARRSANQYRSKSSTSSPLVSNLALENAGFAEQWSELAEKINSMSVRVGNANAMLDAVRRDYEEVGTSLRQYGLTSTMGLLLSHKRTQLEDWKIDGSVGHSVDDEIQRSREKQFENEMVVYDGSDVFRQTSEILTLSGYGPTHREHSSLATQIQALLRERYQWLQLLARGYDDYRQKVGEIDSAATAFDKLTSEYRQLINRHVTWIKSSEPLGITDLRKFQSGIRSLFDSRRSQNFGFSISQKWSSNPASGLMLLGTILIVVLLRIVAKTWLIAIGTRKKMKEATATARKCAASLLTPLLAFAVPSIFYLIARWLDSGFVTESTLHASIGLYAASFVALIIEVPRQLLRTNGFLEKHISIELPRQQRASSYLLVIGTGFVLAAYVVTLAENIDHGTWSGSVARCGFVASLLLVAWTAHLAMNPRGGFLEPLIERFGGIVLHRIRWVYYFLGIGFPMAMIVLSVLGYQYTATEIIKRAGIMFVSTLIAATLWSAVKILFAAAWHALTGTQDETRIDTYGETQTARVAGALADHSLELKHQIAFLSQCAIALAAVVATGWLWSDVFPNVHMGNPVVWTVQETVAQSFFDTNGIQASRDQIVTTPITLLHLVLAGATLFIAFQLAKLLPAIFDALVLQRVSFDEAMEHLSLVLGRCVLFGIGCFVACRLIGVRWEAIQWLAVGLIFGLGFGLQDIVRNLFGGLIVLFEKPARLGDLITVGTVTGRVASQRLRTTVLSDDDGREVIIPNKNFVSQDVVNWMGAGRLKAIPIEVSVTRDERPADVCRMLQQLMLGQPDLLLNPAPQATLVCVSQSSQRIELRAWVEEHQDASRCRDSLTKTVLKTLAEKNLLAAEQPRQPSLERNFDADSIGSLRSRPKRSA